MELKGYVVRFSRLGDGPMPVRQTQGSAGLDLSAATDCRVPAHGYAIVSTGLAIEMPSGLEAQVRPRSGLAANHGIGILNSPGTVDSDYRGEISVVLFNLADEDYQVHVGDRIAQLVFGVALEVRMVEAQELSGTERGEGGFGHTG